ncbi:hypothetical protein HPG69_017281 [Diceros bicornis minor]|uniref:Uncharacterized protein n=1 Tax=Diceros bicornis minor TaxID=77932 RepID=A0A7J7ECX1_DICBM|nr:hypothetical protein HPG69_017281 [Diceros bicornis minor]
MTLITHRSNPDTNPTKSTRLNTTPYRNGRRWTSWPYLYYCTSPSPHFGPNNMNSITHTISTSQHKSRHAVYISQIKAYHILYSLVRFEPQIQNMH